MATMQLESVQYSRACGPRQGRVGTECSRGAPSRGSTLRSGRDKSLTNLENSRPERPLNGAATMVV